MGGGYYDRDMRQAEDVVHNYDNTNPNPNPAMPVVQKNVAPKRNPDIPPKPYSKESEALLAQNVSLHKSMDPKNYIKEKIICKHKNPIVFALDVTGTISFCAIGDAKADKAPLQVTEFGQGKEIDQLISKMFLEDGGGANHHESYELAGYFYNEFCELENTELPFMFITGDEKFFKEIPPNEFEKFLDYKMEETVKSKNVWQKLTKKFNVFLLHKRYYKNDAEVIQEWKEALGENHVFQVTEPKACIDIILGTLAITSGKKTLDTYCEDLKEREQTEERIKEVRNALQNYDKEIQSASAKEKNELLEIVEKDLLPKFVKSEFYIKNEKTILELQKIQKSTDVPKNFICSLRKEIMLEPVKLEDGYVYEKELMSIWLSKEDKSPMTGLTLRHKNMEDMVELKKNITEFYEAKKVLEY